MNLAEKISKSVHGTAFKKSSYMSVLMVIILAIVIAVNIVVSNISTDVTEIDVSENHLYTIGDVTKGVLDGMTDDVEIIVIDREGDVDDRIVRFVRLYSDYSDHVKVSYIDPTLYPSVLNKYDVTADSIVVVCEAKDKKKVITFDDILEYDATSYYYYGTKDVIAFDGEGEITTAIDYVTAENTDTIYTLTGHGESDLGDGIADVISRSNIEVKSWSLMLDGSDVPEDCSTLLIYQPTKDISTDELESIRTYQKNGGNVVLFYGTDDKLTNLEQLMADYGVSTTHGYVGDQSRYYQYMQTALAFFPTYSSGNVTGSLNANSDLTLVYGPMDLSVEEVEGVTVDEFLKTSENGIYMESESEDYVTGKYTIALSAVKTEDEENAVSSTMTIFGCVSLVADSFMDESLSNSEVFMNSITQYYEATENISISSVSLDITFNTFSNYTYIIVALVIFMIAMVVAGIVVWNLRRKL